MKWHEIRTIIRRYLRDPDGNIWDSSILKSLYNDEQADVCNRFGLLTYVDTIRVPPMYDFSYIFEWEYSYAEHDGKNYQCFRYHQQSDMGFQHVWEAEQLGYGTGTASDYGSQYAYPFEYWYCSTPSMPAPVWFPVDFRKTKFIAWNKDPIVPADQKELSRRDPSWHTRSGVPFAYFRKDDLSNEFYLYPAVGTPTWDDIDGDKVEGQILFDDSNTESAEGQTIMDITNQLFNMDEGIATDSLTPDDNITLIYEAEAADVEMEYDEGSLPTFLQKYCRFAVLERAYSMNNDGKIESLRDYWGWRKNIGKTVLQAYKSKKRADRDYQLVTKSIGGRRTIRHPRLPDEYPAQR